VVNVVVSHNYGLWFTAFLRLWWHNTVQVSTVQYSTAQVITVQYSTVQYSTHAIWLQPFSLSRDQKVAWMIGNWQCQ